jgi:hypothetical protein
MKNSDVMQVGTKNSTQENVQLTHLESVSLGLLGLAKESSYFKNQLLKQLYEHELILTDASPLQELNLDYGHVKWIPFINPGVAESKLTWLCREANNTSNEEREKIVQILSLAYQDPTPKMAAWGIVFNETLGVFVAGHPFFLDQCLKYSQVIILGPTWRELESQNLSKQINRASLLTLSRCIEEAKFNLKKLDPEVSSWLLEGSGLELYGAESKEDFTEIVTQVKNCGLPFSSLSEEVDLIALQPCVTGSYETLLAKLTML